MKFKVVRNNGSNKGYCLEYPIVNGIIEIQDWIWEQSKDSIIRRLNRVCQSWEVVHEEAAPVKPVKPVKTVKPNKPLKDQLKESLIVNADNADNADRLLDEPTYEQWAGEMFPRLKKKGILSFADFVEADVKVLMSMYVCRKYEIINMKEEAARRALS